MALILESIDSLTRSFARRRKPASAAPEVKAKSSEGVRPPNKRPDRRARGFDAFDREKLAKFIAGQAADRAKRGDNAAILQALIEAATILIDTHGAFDAPGESTSMMNQDASDISLIREDKGNAEIWVNVAIKMFTAFAAHIPHDVDKASFGVTMQAEGVVRGARELIGHWALILSEKNGYAATVMKPWHRVVRDNMKAMRGVRVDLRVVSPGDLFPSERRSKISSYDLAHDAFRGTPLLDLLSIHVPVPIPDHVRVQHCNITAPSGSGKTQFLQNLLLGDVNTFNGVLLFDTDGDLSDKLIRNGLTDKSKLVYIDPSKPDMRPEINILNLGPAGSPKQLIAYVMSALGEDLTGKMGGFFDWMAQVVSEIPGATLDTLIDILASDAKAQFHVGELSKDTADFVTERLPSGNYAQTREQVGDRLLRFRAMGELGRMFRGKTTRLDLAELLDQGKVVVIRIDKRPEEMGGLGSYASLACRFFLAALVTSAQQRTTSKRPNYWWIYLDEVADMIGGGDDKFLVEAFIQLRKKKVGLIVAYQFLKQLKGDLREAALGNTSIKLAGRVKKSDRDELSAAMSCDKGLFNSLTKRDRQWAEMVLYIDQIVDQSAVCRFPLGAMEAMPRLSDDGYHKLMSKQRDMWAEINGTQEEPEEFETEDVVPMTRYREAAGGENPFL